MTDTDFEIRLARALRVRAEDSVEPFDAGRIAEAAIGASRRRPGFVRMALVAAAVVALAVVGTAGAVFVGELLNPPPTPPVMPSPNPSASAEGPLGGGLILAFRPDESAAPCGLGSRGPFELLTVDPGTGTQTLLGTIGEDCSARYLTLQWARDRGRVLVTDEFGQETLTLDTPTSAGRDLTFICCDLPTDVWEGGAHHFDGWLISPAGDRVAAVHTAELQLPGEQGTLGISDGIVVANIDGTGVATLTLPAGAAIRGWANWSPDQSALVVAACRPCNHAIEDEPPTATNHDHLYIVPLDGSPVRELLDDTDGWLWTPTWSPDGTTLATVRSQCSSDEAPPQCGGDISSSLVLVAAEGTPRVLVSSDQLGAGSSIGLPLWSGDGGRIAFSTFSATGDDLEPHVFVIDADGTDLIELGAGDLIQWSPDGEWLLVDRPAAVDGFSEVWIMRADGSDARPLGTFLRWIHGAAW